MTYKKKLYGFAVSALLLSPVFCSCAEQNKEKTPGKESDIIIAVGDSVLRTDRVIQNIPAGLSVEDSLTMYNAIVEDWLRERLLCDVALDNLPHPEKIEKQVSDYRNRLITIEYRQLMGDRYTEKTISEDSVKAYFIANKESFKLSEPIIKGLYIKLPATDRELDNIRKWMMAANAPSIDKLEKHGLKNAMQYDHFTDRWIDWQTVADQIPYRFGNPDRFFTKGKMFETEHNGSIYMLHITDVLHSGEKMPYEFAATQIRNMMSDANRSAYDNELLKGLYEKAKKEGRLKDNR